MRYLLLFVLFLAACGGPKDQVVSDTCQPIDGKFMSTYTLEAAEGNCAQAKEVSLDPMEFYDGHYVSPVGDLASCVLSQQDCAIHVTCTTALLPAKLEFNGVLSGDGTQLTGDAVLSGNYAGCTYIHYAVNASK